LRFNSERSRTKWEMSASDYTERAKISALHPVIESLLHNRGIRDSEALLAFLNPDFCQEHDPYLFRDMEVAVARLKLARARNEKVLIHGDYDADGVTSAAMLFLAFRQCGIRSQVYIPSREEGYGIQSESLHEAKNLGISLVVTADCGVQAIEETKLATDLGIEMIITDHHTPAQALPPALAIINPKVMGCPYPFKGLSGVGVAYKLAAALLGEDARVLLDFVAVGTVADLVPLVDENRLYVKKGLEALANPRSGFKALMAVSGVKSTQVTAGNIAYMLAPRLNAAGRINDAVPALELLLTEDDGRAQALAENLDQFNRERQRIEEEVLLQALSMVDASASAIVLYRAEWSAGVVGIVASRLVERFYKPTILLCREEGGAWRGSGRSIAGFDLISALRRCQDLLLKCGGHAMAAGLTLLDEHLENFRTCFLGLANDISLDLLIPKLSVQAELKLEDLSQKLVADIALLAPFGVGNPQPIFASAPCKLVGKSLVGTTRQHLRMVLARDDGEKISAVMFREGQRISELSIGCKVRIAFRASLDTYKGRTQISIQVQDFVPGAEWWVVSLPILAEHRFSRFSPSQRDAFFVPVHEFKERHYRLAGEELADEAALKIEELDTIYLVSPTPRVYTQDSSQRVNYVVSTDIVYNNIDEITLLVPERERLMTYYRWLKQRSAFSLDEFAGEYQLPLSVAHSLCAAVLRIFTEIDLLEFKYTAGLVTLTHSEHDGVRRDLAHSHTFKALSAWKKEAIHD